MSRRSAPAVHIAVYDGPLDLLLLLIRREGVDVRSIPVARICDAYLAELDTLLSEGDGIDIDAAGDYLVLAATLCQIKARELLPRPADAAVEEEEEDPKERLAQRLLEYERFRLAAEEMGARERLDRDVYARPTEPPAPDEQPLDPGCNALDLLRMYYEMETRRAAPPPVHEVHREPLSFATTVRWVLDRLDDQQEHLLSEFFLDESLLGQHQRPRRVYTFLAVLEMARLSFLDLAQHVHLGAIRIVGRVRRDEADLSALPEDT